MGQVIQAPEVQVPVIAAHPGPPIVLLRGVQVLPEEVITADLQAVAAVIAAADHQEAVQVAALAVGQVIEDNRV